MSDYRSLSFEGLCALLEQAAPTLILLRRNPDAGTVGSAFALRQALENMGSPTRCIGCDEIPAHLTFLMSDTQASVLPDSLSEDFFPERVISVGASSVAQLGALREIYEGQVDLMLCHSESFTPFADYHLPEEAATTGEILFDVVKDLAQRGLVTVTEALCTDLYVAISGETGGFRSANVTPATHVRVAELMASGIDHAAISRRLFETRSMEQLRAVAAGISNLHLFGDGRVAVILFPYAIKAALGLDDSHLDLLVDVARSLEGVKLAVVLRQPTTEAVFRISARSLCDYDVASLCARFGGMGTARAAACTIHAADAEAAMEKFTDSIDFSDLY